MLWDAQHGLSLRCPGSPAPSRSWAPQTRQCGCSEAGTSRARSPRRANLTGAPETFHLSEVSLPDFDEGLRDLDLETARETGQGRGSPVRGGLLVPLRERWFGTGRQWSTDAGEMQGPRWRKRERASSKLR